MDKKNVVDLQPPPIKMKLGISKKKMNKEAIEQVINKSHLKRANFGIKCSRCHKDGHNKATCKLPTTSTQLTSVATSTQPTPTATSTQPTLPAASTQPTSTATSTQQPPKKKMRLQKGLKLVMIQP